MVKSLIYRIIKLHFTPSIQYYFCGAITHLCPTCNYIEIYAYLYCINSNANHYNMSITVQKGDIKLQSTKYTEDNFCGPQEQCNEAHLCPTCNYIEIYAYLYCINSNANHYNMSITVQKGDIKLQSTKYTEDNFCGPQEQCNEAHLCPTCNYIEIYAYLYCINSNANHYNMSITVQKGDIKLQSTKYTEDNFCGPQEQCNEAHLCPTCNYIEIYAYLYCINSNANHYNMSITVQKGDIKLQSTKYTEDNFCGPQEQCNEAHLCPTCNYIEIYAYLYCINSNANRYNMSITVQKGDIKLQSTKYTEDNFCGPQEQCNEAGLPCLTL